LFERMLIRQRGTNQLSIGQIAKLLLFYEQVIFVCDLAEAIQLADLIGTSNAIELIHNGNLRIKITRDFFGVRTERRMFKMKHALACFELSQLTDGTKIDDKNFFAETINRDSTAHSKDLLAYLEQCDIIRHTDEHVFGKILPAARADLFKKELCSSDAKLFLESHYMDLTLPPNIRFFAHPIDEHHFKIVTNFRLENPHFASEQILSRIVEARFDLGLSATQRSDVILSPQTTTYIHHRVNHLLELSTQNQENMDRFLDVIIESYLAFDHEIRNKNDFEKFLNIIFTAEKFRVFVKNVPNDKNLVEHFTAELLNHTGKNSRKSETLRWCLLNTATIGAGVAFDPVLAAGGSLMLSALDHFLLSQIMGGWAPNQFVEKNLKPFFSRP